jgi:4-hydroxy-2-oxoheptanedioate aldolase
MEPFKNLFKQRILNNDTTLGVWACIGNSQATEIVACMGYDWMVLEGEHSPNSLKDFLHQLQTVASYNVHPIVRPPSDDPIFIKQILELGVQTILIPVVETKEQAENIVKSTRYPPEGFRGMGSVMARSGRWGAINKYPANANKEICVIAMIETKKGLDNLESILTVDGIDAVFFGPNDLSADLGVIDDVLNPVVVDAIKSGIELAVKHKKTSGVLTLNLEMLKEYTDTGARMLGVGLDSMLLLNAGRNLLVRAKGRISKHLK